MLCLILCSPDILAADNGADEPHAQTIQTEACCASDITMTQAQRLSFRFIKDAQSIAYHLQGDGSIEDFPCSTETANTARIMQNIEGDKYFAAEAKTFSVQSRMTL